MTWGNAMIRRKGDDSDVSPPRGDAYTTGKRAAPPPAANDAFVGEGQLHQLSRDSAYIAIDLPKPILGHGLRLSMTLRPGGKLELLGRVKRIRGTSSITEPRGVEVSFVSPSPFDVRGLEIYLDAVLRQAAPPDPVRVAVAERFAVETSEDLLRIRLCGLLKSECSQELSRQVQANVLARPPGRTVVYIDGVNLLACPEDSLAHVREWMAALHARRPFYAVAVVPNAVASLQIRRLTRETGIGDEVAFFDNENDALSFLSELRGSSLG